MKNKKDYVPAATVHALYVPDSDDLFPLTEEFPLTPKDVQENPVVIDMDFAPEYDHESIIVDLIYDNMDPIPLPDLIRGFNIPRCVPYWFHWFDIPAGELYDKHGRIAYPRALGVHTVQIRTARKTGGIAGKERNFSPANAGWMSPVFTFVIAEDDPGDPDDSGESDDGEYPGYG